jgi:hypothetical protein
MDGWERGGGRLHKGILASHPLPPPSPTHHNQLTNAYRLNMTQPDPQEKLALPIMKWTTKSFSLVYSGIFNSDVFIECYF